MRCSLVGQSCSTISGLLNVPVVVFDYASSCITALDTQGLVIALLNILGDGKSSIGDRGFPGTRIGVSTPNCLEITGKSFTISWESITEKIWACTVFCQSFESWRISKWNGCIMRPCRIWIVLDIICTVVQSNSAVNLLSDTDWVVHGVTIVGTWIADGYFWITSCLGLFNHKIISLWIIGNEISERSIQSRAAVRVLYCAGCYRTYWPWHVIRSCSLGIGKSILFSYDNCSSVWPSIVELFKVHTISC